MSPPIIRLTAGIAAARWWRSFNPGKQQRTFPAYNPYTISKCRTCPKSNLNLAADIPANQNCSACGFIHDCYVNRDDVIHVGDGTISISKLINKEDSDFDKLMQVAHKFAKEGADVRLTPKMTRPAKLDYDCVYGSLKGTKYYGKCPDMLIDGLWYEHEGFTSPKNALRNMFNNGLKQSSRLIIDKPKESDAQIKRTIKHRISLGQSIDEVWVKDESGVRCLYKKV